MDGPFVTAALFCERALEEKDGVVSAIRIVDRVTSHIASEGEQDAPPPLRVSITALISLKPGRAVGRYSIGFRPEAPSGAQLAVLKTPVNFDESDGSRGVNLVLPVEIEAEEGLYWFDVLWIDDRAGTEELLTRMPLRVLWQPMPGPQ